VRVDLLSAQRRYSQTDRVTRSIDAPLFTHGNLAEIEHPDFAGERLVACFNPLLAMDRNHTREELLDCTETLLRKLASHVQSRKEKPFTAAEIGVKAGAS